MSRRMVRRVRAVVVVGLALVLLSVGPAYAQDQLPATTVKSDFDYFFRGPSSEGPWLVYARSKGYGAPSTVFAQRGTARPRRISRPGTTAEAGGIDRHRVVYAARTNRPETSDWDLYRHDLRTRRHPAFPRVVNGPNDERDPTSSGPYVLFQRDRTTGQGTTISKVMLYDRRTHTTEVLDREHTRTAVGRYAGVSTGQVNGDYAVWAHLYRVYDSRFHPQPGSYDEVFRYHLPTGTTERVFFDELGGEPSGTRAHRSAWSPGVSKDGTVYFWRTAFYVDFPGDDPWSDLLRLTTDGIPQVIHSAHGDYADGGGTYVVDRPDGTRTVYFMQNDAAGSETYLMKIDDQPAAAPTSARRSGG